MAKLVNNGNARVRLTFLAMDLQDKNIELFSIENKTIDPLSNLPTDPIFSRKYQYNNQFNMQGDFIGQTTGQEQFEEVAVQFVFQEDFMFVKAGKQDITERASRDTLIAILQGAVFKSNGKTYRVLGNAGNINLEAKMLGNKVNKHWKNLYYWENAFVREGTAFDDKGNARLMQNPLLSTFNVSNIGMSLEVYIGAGTGETRVMRYPLVAFNQITTDMSGDVIKINTNMEIKADVIEADDFFIAGGKQVSPTFIKVDGVIAQTGLSSVPIGAKANEKWLAYDDVTGKVMYIDNQVDKTSTTPLEVGTIFYLQKADTGATSGVVSGLCQAGTGVVKKSPEFYVVGKYNCATPEAYLTRWNFDSKIVTSSANAKDVFALKVNDFDDLTGDFKRYNSENL